MWQIVVEGVAGKSYQGDIAVDDMKLIKSPCPLPGKSVTSKTMERVFDLEMVEPITKFKTHDYLPF